MLALERAQERILSLVQPLGSERLPLLNCVRRYAAEPVLATQDLPPFDNSAMDGYAVRAQDLARPKTNYPLSLRLIGQVAAGESFTGALGPGECVRIFTGSPLPTGADAVVMQEDTALVPTDPHQVAILEPVTPAENVRFRGEDLKTGQTLVPRGARLGAAQLALLASMGLGEVLVGRRPTVGLLATGNELREPGQPLAPGQIYESNRATLAALTTGLGAIPRIYPLVADTPDATRSALLASLDACDITMTSGGVSVGELDFVKASFEQIGGELDFWRVAIKPGKPFVLGKRQGKLLFGLPGNPVSAFVTFLLLVAPPLLKLQGAQHVALPKRSGVLAETLVNRGDRRHFMRVHLDETGEVRLAGRQASHLLHSLAAANALADVAPDTTIPAGTTISVLTGWD